MEHFYFVVQTTMEKEDYKKFLYIATFGRNKLVLPMIFGLSLLGGAAIQFGEETFQLLNFLLTTLLLFVAAVGTICFKVERKNKQRIATDKTGTFGSICTLRFGEDAIKMENEAMHSTGEIQYQQIYQLLETRDYFIFYLAMHQASLVRKKDVEDVAALQHFLRERFVGKYKTIGSV